MKSMDDVLNRLTEEDMDAMIVRPATTRTSTRATRTLPSAA